MSAWAAAADVFGTIWQQNASARESSKNRSFQERMSNTAVQRRMKDLRLAGINPILAGKWEASSPAGNMANMSGPTGIGNTINTGQLVKAQKKKMATEGENIEADTRLKDQSTSESVARANNFQSQDALAQAQTNKVIAETLNVNTAGEVLKLNKEILALSLPGVRAEADLWLWLTEAKIDEISKAMGKAGPMLAPLFRVIMLNMRKK